MTPFTKKYCYTKELLVCTLVSDVPATVAPCPESKQVIMSMYEH